MNRKSLLSLAFAAAGATAALVPATAQAEPSTPEGAFTIQGTCGDKFNPVIAGASAAWSVVCRGDFVYMDGWVSDNRTDGFCAEVQGVFPGGQTQYAADCTTGGARTDFTFKAKGRTAFGYLYLA